MSKGTGLRAIGLALMLAGATGILAAGAALAQDWKPEFKDGKLQPLPDGFPSEDITLIVPDSPSSAEGILMQNLIEAVGRYAPVNVKGEAREDFEAFGSWEALKYLKDTEGGPEGYLNLIFGTPGSLVDLHTAPVTKDIGISLDDLKEVITLEDRRYVVIACATAPFDSWDGLLEYMKANPGKLRYMGGGAGAGTDMTFAYYIHQLGLGSLYDKAYINHIDVGNTSDRALATAACEGDITTTTMDLAMTHTQSGKVKVILVGGDQPVAQFAGVPTAAEKGIKEDPMSSTKMIAVIKGVDPQRVQWLYALWNAVANDADYQAIRTKVQVGTIVKILDPAASDALNKASDAKMVELTKLLGINTD
jgi:tripartite-type tricarboxylate transporter receptor subunit TctC